MDFLDKRFGITVHVIQYMQSILHGMRMRKLAENLRHNDDAHIIAT